MSSSKLLIAVDNGYFATKYMSENVINSFESKVKEGTFNLLNDENTYTINLEINNRRTFLVGKSASKQTFEFDKTTNDISKVLIYNAICLCMDNNASAEVKLVVGTPLAQYKAQREKLELYLKTNDYTQVFFDRKKERKLIWIKDIKVLPQCAASFFTLPNTEVSNKNILILDWGGYTLDVAGFINGSIKQESMITIPKGIIPLKLELMNKINMEFGQNLDISDVDMILNNGLYLRGKKVETDIINKTIDNYVDEAINMIILKGLNIDTYEVLGTGGGSILLEKYLRKHITHIKLMENAQYTNVIGYYNAGKKIFS